MKATSTVLVAISSGIVASFFMLPINARNQGPTSLPLNVESQSSVVQPSEKTVGAVNGFVDFDPQAKPYAYLASAAIWKWPAGAKKKIFVCWENPTNSNAAGRTLVEESIKKSWQGQSELSFEGWQACAQGNYGIHIQIDDIGPHTKGLGRQLDRVKNGMVLNFTFRNWSPVCARSQSAMNSCIRSIAVHEFGHALGFAHEQNRYDAPGECGSMRQGSNGDLLLTPYDPKSVMNYCNETYNNNGELSENDRAALISVYGAPR